MLYRILKPLGLSGYQPGTVLPGHQLEDYGLDLGALTKSQDIEPVQDAPVGNKETKK